MARQAGLTEEDLRLWAAYGRTLTRLMPGRAHLIPPPEPAAPAMPLAPVPAVAAKPGLARPPAGPGLNAAPAGLDKSAWTKFRTGRTRVEARLDLHGMTAATAHHEVRRFLEAAHGAGLRCVEIVTGKGEVLARELPHWLGAPPLRPLLLAFAHPHPANTGALRILLRRRRP